MASRVTRLVALFLSFAFGVIGGSVGLNGLIKGNQAKTHLRHLVPAGVTVDINTNDVFDSGVVLTTVGALIAVLSLVSLLAAFAAPARFVRAQAFALAFCAVWLFATLIPFDVFFANNSAKVTAFLNGVQLPPQAVQTVQNQLGVSSRYKDMDYLRLVAIIPWFTFLFAAIAAGVLLAAPRNAYAADRAAAAPVSEKQSVAADTKDIKAGADTDVKGV